MPGVEYDVTDHILLSVDAKALDPDVLRGEILAAELCLGLVGTGYTGTMRERALVAVVRQVNFQVDRSGSRPGIKSETEGDRSYDYVTDGQGQAAPLDSQAQLIAGLLRISTPANWL